MSDPQTTRVTCVSWGKMEVDLGRETHVDVMILSRGQALALHTCPETEQVLRDRGIEYRIEETKRAVELFNAFTQEGRRAGGVFHSTC